MSPGLAGSCITARAERRSKPRVKVHTDTHGAQRFFSTPASIVTMARQPNAGLRLCYANLRGRQRDSQTLETQGPIMLGPGDGWHRVCAARHKAVHLGPQRRSGMRW